MKTGRLFLPFVLGAVMTFTANAQLTFPFFDDVENDSLSSSYWRPDSGSWTIAKGIAHTGTGAWEDVPTTSTYQWLTMAGTLNLSSASNPFLSFWIRQTQTTNAYSAYRVQVSNDGGASWLDLIGETYAYLPVPWTRLQASLANYRQPGVLIRIGVRANPGYTSPPTFLVDDVLVDNAPTPTWITLTEATNTGMKISWGQSMASDFANYRIVLSTDMNGVNDPYTASSVSGRTERRVLNVAAKSKVDTTLTDVVFTNMTYYAKMYESDTQGFTNQGTDYGSQTTAFAMVMHMAPFVENFEGLTQLAADVPWAITTTDAADTGHTATHAYEDSPNDNYPANADRRLVLQANLSTAQRPVLRFKHRYGFEYGNDFGYVEASRDTINWITAGIYTGSWNTWRQEELDLGTFARSTPVFVRFRTVSNSSQQLDGWHLDDVEIYNNTRTSQFPFADDMEVDSASAQRWIAANWNRNGSGHNSSWAWQITPTTSTYQWLTMAGTLNLSSASNPFLSFWIRQTQTTNAYSAYRVQVSNDGGASWLDLIGETYAYLPVPWTRLQASLANYRQPGVLIRIGVRANPGYTSPPTFLVDDVLVDNAPTPTWITLTEATNTGMKISWGQSMASDFANYRIVLSTDMNGVNDPYTASSVSGRTERRVLNVAAKSKVDTTLTDVVFTNMTYYAKMYESDTQGFTNQGTDYGSQTTAFAMVMHMAPFVENFEGLTQLAADVPWAITTTDAADTGHTATHAYEDSPNDNYPANADRRLVLQANLSTAQRPVLRFKHRYGFEYGNDFGYVEASRDTINWITAGIYTGSWNTWRQEELDLGTFARSTPVFVRFRTVSNSSQQLDGWHLDDVEIYNNTRTSQFPFADDMEVDSASAQRWIAANWNRNGSGHNSSWAWQITPTTSTYQWLTMAGTLNLSSASNPFLSFWIRQTQTTNAYSAYRVQVSNDGGASWLDLIGETYAYLPVPWTRLQASLANYRQPGVLIRIGVRANPGYTSPPTFLVDDVVIDVSTLVDDHLGTMPTCYSLAQNYPNPFNPSTTIRYGLPQRGYVTLAVFNTLGQMVADLQNGEQEAGYHEVRFDAAEMASGVYFYRIQAGAYVETRKLLLIR